MFNIENAASVCPTRRQLLWNQMEFYGFVHFGLYTYETDADGNSSPEIFDPKDFDAKQWVKAFKSAGMTGLLLTCKHHEGFCLWPSKYTDFSIKASPWKDGKGDIVKEVSDACKEEGLKFGVYLSPWDMHEKSYGTKAYNRYFLNQLEELLTNYGEIFTVWFDGACRETQKEQPYDWDSYYELIRRLQPDACISICGPDVRWCGNEAGQCRTSEWSVVPKEIMTTERNPGYWRKIDTIPNSTWTDLGSREFLSGFDQLIWYPAEVDVSIRPSWGYIKGEEKKLHTLKTLMHMYECSVGGNANLLLNVPPNPQGLFDKEDIERLAELGEKIRQMFANSQMEGAIFTSSDTEEGYSAENVCKKDRTVCWRTKKNTERAELLIELPEKRKINLIVLQEAIEAGQHIEAFTIAGYVKDQWTTVFRGETIGYKKFCRTTLLTTDKIRITINGTREFAALTQAALFFDEQNEA